MSVHDISVQTIAGEPATLADFGAGPMLVVNVASRCGLTPQYGALQLLHERYADQGLPEEIAHRHPLYAELTRTASEQGKAGDVQRNFEKFLLAAGGEVANRFRPRTGPLAPEVIAAVEAALDGAPAA